MNISAFTTSTDGARRVGSRAGMPLSMLRWLLSRTDAWRTPSLEAERIVMQQDAAALSMVAALAADPKQPLDERRYHARVLRIAIERQALSDGVDRRTRDCLYERWEARRGSFIP